MMTQEARIYDFSNVHMKLNQKNNQKKNGTTTSTTGGTGTSSTGRARANVRRNFSKREISPEEMAAARERKAIFERFIERFEATFDQWAGVSVREEVKNAIMGGCCEEVLNFCLEEAECAPRPSWGYARAVLRRLISEGVLSADDLAHEQEKRAGMKRSGGSSGRTAGFMQREYREEDFAHGFFVEWDPDEDEDN